VKPTGGASGPPGGLLPDDDAELLAELGELLALADPVPEHLVEHTQFALDLADLDVEVARWQELETAGVRSRTGPSTITFTVEDLTVMVSLAASAGGNRFDGWLVPGGPHAVEVRVEGHESVSTVADEGGRFALAEVPCGLTQILVHLVHPTGGRTRTVVTPTILL
jgi:hypothetical protein